MQNDGCVRFYTQIAGNIWIRAGVIPVDTVRLGALILNKYRGGQ
jgi:hypothetical protein